VASHHQSALVRPSSPFSIPVAVETLWKRWDVSSTVSISTSSFRFFEAVPARVAQCLRCRTTSTEENKHDIGFNVAVEPMPCPARPKEYVRAISIA
jgi:hypothetical protein